MPPVQIVGCLTLILLSRVSYAQPAVESTADLVEYVTLEKPDIWKSSTTGQLRGEIQQFNAHSLLLVDTSGQFVNLPSGQVAHVATRWRNEPALAAHQLFLNKRYRDAFQAIPEALQTGLPQWQQRFLIAELVQSVDALGDTRVAGIYFLNLANSQPPALFYDCMPLCWISREPPEALRAEARKWLEQTDSEEAQLLGASWLLFGDQHQQAAQTITRLRSAKNSTIGQYAVAQSWRLQPPPQTMNALQQWFEFRDKLLPPLQLGPTEFLADRLMRIGKADLALGQWLRIATLHPTQFHRANVALELATAQLKRLERTEEAQGLESWIAELRGELPAE